MLQHRCTTVIMLILTRVADQMCGYEAGVLSDSGCRLRSVVMAGVFALHCAGSAQGAAELRRSWFEWRRSV
jgi:hypothetical protein